MFQCFLCEERVAAHHLVGVSGLLVCPSCAARAVETESPTAPLLILAAAIQEAETVWERAT
jgi:hypothetical protein